MMEPTMDYLAKMALVEAEGENTEVLSVREEVKRKFYFDKFHVNRNKVYTSNFLGLKIMPSWPQNDRY